MSEVNAQNVETLNDGTAGDCGTIYEKRFCMLFAVHAYSLGLKDFQLRYQVPEKDVGKFDDIVFDAGQKVFQVFQLKHKENEQTKITNLQLFNESFNTDYNLLKYIKSLKDLNTKNTFKGKVQMAVVLTNIDFDLQSDNKLKMKNDPKGWYDSKTEIQFDPLTLNQDAIFNTSKYQFLNKEAKYYKFDDDKIIGILKNHKKTLILNLTEELNIEVKETGNPKYDKQQETLKKNKEALKKWLEDITEDDIRNALKFIIYAVNQPNDAELEQIIKEEIMEHFKLQNVDTVYNAFENAFTKWCSKKVPINDLLSSSKQQIIGFKDIKIFFEKIVKKFSFGVTAPTLSFTGRSKDLDNIRKKLKGQHDLIISQLPITGLGGIKKTDLSQVAITGLGGIGKTELTKKFIEKYGQSDFYGRVIWIEAENDESVKNSFQRLAVKIKIQDTDKKKIIDIIEEVFEYCCGVKVLFVFDNFDKNTEGNSSNNVDKNFVIYCRKRASGLPTEDRPYFIFTSRNRNCLPGVESLDLSVLMPEDAQKLVMDGVKNSTKEDLEDAGNLAERLQCFPLALNQAIAYINKQNEIKSVTRGRYEIKDYLTEFDKKTKELLNFKYTNDFGEYEKTTFVTWNVTLNAILKDEDGDDAIQVLKIMSYLYADKIDANMFLELFEYDKTRCGKAIILLNKYSLITKIEDNTFYQIHRLVQAVIQLKYKELEEEILVQAWKFVNLELNEKFFLKEQNLLDWVFAQEKCIVDQYLHYNNLSTYMKNYEKLKENFGIFFYYIYNSVLDSVVEEDDIEKLKELNLPKDVLKEYTENRFEDMIKSKNNKAIIYLIENGYLDFNDEMPLKCLDSFEPNPDLFKYFVEKYKSELTILSTEFICDIKKEKSDSLLELIESEKSDENVRKLKESLLFASLYNQESIVKLLIDNNIKPDYKIEKWNINHAPIVVAVRFEYSHIVKILLKPFDNIEFWKDFLQSIFEFLELFAEVNNVEHGGRNFTNLYYAKNFKAKVKIAYRLLNRFKDPIHFNFDKMLSETIEIIKNDPVKNSLYDKMLIKMRSNVPKCEFITLLGEAEIDDQILDTLEMLKNINNYKDETELISCVRDLSFEFCALHHFDTVETIVNEGVDVNAMDQNGNNALYYAVDLKQPDIFDYLLPKTNSEHEKIFMKAIITDKLFCVYSLLETHFSHDHIFSDKKSLWEVANENNSFAIIYHLQKLSKVYEIDEMGLINYIKNCLKIRCDVDEEYVKFLLDNGVDVNTMDSEQHNALYYSLEFKKFCISVCDDLFSFLLDKNSLVHEDTLERAIELDRYRAIEKIIPKYFSKDYFLKKKSCSISEFAEQCEANRVQKFLLGEEYYDSSSSDDDEY